MEIVSRIAGEITHIEWRGFPIRIDKHTPGVITAAISPMRCEVIGRGNA